MVTVRILLALFFIGWATYQFALFTVAGFSVTVLLVSSALLALRLFRPGKLFSWPLLLVLASAVLSANVAAFRGVQSDEIIKDLIQSGIGLFVAMAFASIRWQRYVDWLRRFLVPLGTFLGAFGAYQLAARKLGWPLAFLPITNEQIGSDLGYQRGFLKTLDQSGGFLRVSSTFPEPSDLARFMLWVFCFGYTAKDRRVAVSLQAIAVFGILVSQSLGGMIGLLVIIVVDAAIRVKLRRIILPGLALALALGLISALSPNVLHESSERLRWIRSMGIEYLTLTGRFRDVAANWSLFAETPILGHGIGSLVSVAPFSVVADSFSFLAIERGLVGGMLFLLPFLVLFLGLSRRENRLDGSRASLGRLLLLVEIYHFFTFSALYFPPIYAALGIAMNDHRPQPMVLLQSTSSSTYPRS